MNDEEKEDDPNADSGLIDRSPSTRLVLFSTLAHLLTLPSTSIDLAYVEGVVESLSAHQPLLSREIAKAAEVWMHVGREEEAVQWVRRLIAQEGEGQTVDSAVVETLRSRAQSSGLRGVARRLEELKHLLLSRQGGGEGKGAPPPQSHSSRSTPSLRSHAV